jgi:3-hydroxyisobutyrate dehydrogenase-like beta-hydroxyacid dehydrogenase
MATFALVGFGELGSSLALGLGRSGAHTVRAYTRERSSPAAADALEDRLRASGAHRSASLLQALSGATAVLAVVPAGASREVVERCAPLLDAGAYYVDLTAAPIVDKQLGAALVADAGALYVDGAVLGTVAMSGFEVPVLVSGPGAQGWQALVAPEGLEVEVLEGPAGHATLLKLLRSVYMKGREALIVEMMLAARSYGLAERVAHSIQGPGERVSFPALAERVLCSLAVYAERRGDELLASSEVVRAAGVDPVVARAGAEALHRLAELELRDAFGRERPTDAEQVLAAIEERMGRPTARES